jgi:sugar lactone lactonase YvrE
MRPEPPSTCCALLALALSTSCSFDLTRAPATDRSTDRDRPADSGRDLRDLGDLAWSSELAVHDVGPDARTADGAKPADATSKPDATPDAAVKADGVSSTAMVSTLAGGCGESAGYQPGVGTAARFSGPRGLAFSIVLYVADTGNHRIRSVDATGNVALVAGTGVAAGSAASVGALLATFSSPHDVAVTSTNHVLVADTKNRAIRDLHAGTVTEASTFSDEVRSVAAGGTFVFSSIVHRVVRFDAAKAQVVAGSVFGYADQAGGVDQALFNTPSGLAAGSLAASAVYVADTLNHRVRLVSFSAPGYVATLAGNGAAGLADGGPSTGQLNKPEAVALDPVNDRVFIADTANHSIRVWSSATKVLSTVAGNGTPGYQDGVGPVARFTSPAGIAVVPGQAGKPSTIYVADTGNHCIRTILLP